MSVIETLSSRYCNSHNNNHRKLFLYTCSESNNSSRSISTRNKLSCLLIISKSHFQFICIKTFKKVFLSNFTHSKQTPSMALSRSHVLVSLSTVENHQACSRELILFFRIHVWFFNFCLCFFSGNGIRDYKSEQMRVNMVNIRLA